jgi:16S rRNA C967 or C1407 C5-methylase (RsmB/RsmF family)
LLRENLLRLGQRESVIAVRSDLQGYAATHPHPFDAILIDAPLLVAPG